MLKNLSFVSLAFLYVNILGYVFHFYVSRKLGPILYGEFMVVYSLMLTVANFSGIFSTVTVKTIVEEKNKIGALRYLRRIGLLAGFIACFLGMVLSPALKDLLSIDNMAYLWVVSFVWLFMFSVAVERGYLQARNMFGKFAISTSLELTVRLLSVVILLFWGFGIYGALGSSGIGLVTAFFYLLIVNGLSYDSAFGETIPFSKLVKIAAYISPAGFLLYADSLFIRRIFDPFTAGIFASVSILGKAAVWFCISAFSVFFPSFVELKLKDKNRFFKLVFYSFLFVTVFYFFVEVGIAIIGKRIFMLVFGKKFISGFRYLWIYVLSVYPLTLTILFINVLTAVQKYVKIIYIQLFFFYLLFFVLTWIHPSIGVYLLLSFVESGFFAVLYSILLLIEKNRVMHTS